MLSKKEREFVEDPFRFSNDRAKVLRHRVKKKLKKAKSDFDLLHQNRCLTRIDPTELLAVTIAQDDHAHQRNLSDETQYDKGTSGFQENETKRYDSLSELENW